jgi:hypothetical protein
MGAGSGFLGNPRAIRGPRRTQVTSDRGERGDVQLGAHPATDPEIPMRTSSRPSTLPCRSLSLLAVLLLSVTGWTQVTSRQSLPTGAAEGNGRSQGASVSADGHYLDAVREPAALQSLTEDEREAWSSAWERARR